MWGAIGGAVTGGMNSPHCFVAGTLVCTIDGEEFTTTDGHPLLLFMANIYLINKSKCL